MALPQCVEIPKETVSCVCESEPSIARNLHAQLYNANAKCPFQYRSLVYGIYTENDLSDIFGTATKNSATKFRRKTQKSTDASFVSFTERTVHEPFVYRVPKILPLLLSSMLSEFYE